MPNTVGIGAETTDSGHERNRLTAAVPKGESGRCVDCRLFDIAEYDL